MTFPCSTSPPSVQPFRSADQWINVQEVSVPLFSDGPILIASLFPIVSAQSPAEAQSSNSTATVQKAPAQIRWLKVALLSTMLVGSTTGLGGWGFPALIEADGHRVLLDTGAHPDTVLQNARDWKIDLSDVREVILTHSHWDHASGLMTLRKEMTKKNPSALSVVHVARGIFYSRPAPEARITA